MSNQNTTCATQTGSGPFSTMFHKRWSYPSFTFSARSPTSYILNPGCQSDVPRNVAVGQLGLAFEFRSRLA